jgi:hypothetical protein
MKSIGNYNTTVQFPYNFRESRLKNALRLYNPCHVVEC